MTKLNVVASFAFAGLIALQGCVVDPGIDPVTVDPTEMSPDLGGAEDSARRAIPEVMCTGTPTNLADRTWRHTRSALTSVPSPQHRGIDLIVGAGSRTQMIRGDISYGIADDGLEDELVEIFACKRGAWSRIGTAITNDDGEFALPLTGASRLAIGMRSLYVSVVGDRTGTDFLAFVAPEGTQIVFSDIDGTLTSSENAYPISLVTRSSVQANAGAPEVITALRQRNYYPIYMTARGRVFTGDTRAWLRDRGFPVGPLRLAPSVITLPGSATVAYKSDTIDAIAAEGLVPAVGIGNRASDAAAYGSQSIPGNRIFLKAKEFASEDAPVAARGEAITFQSYVDLLPTVRAIPAAR